MADPGLWDDLQLAFLRSPETSSALDALDRRGGWRTLLDTSSEEWNWSTIEEKAQLLGRFAAAGFGNFRILAAFSRRCEARGREDLIKVAVQAIYLIVGAAEEGRPADRGGVAPPGPGEERTYHV